jgi:hypothetical protein
MVRDGLTGPLHEPYGAAYHRRVERHGLRTPPARDGTFRGLFLVTTVADGSDREMLVMGRDELMRPLHEPYGAYYLGMWSLVLFYFVGPYRLSCLAGDMV